MPIKNKTPQEHPSAETKLDPPMSLVDHLIELRSRLILSLIVFMVSTGSAYYFAESIFGFLVTPLAKILEGTSTHRLIYTGLAEAFVTYLKVALFVGGFIAFPFVVIQVWKFIAPGLYRHERRVFLKFLIATPLLFLTGAAFAYYLVIPAAWKFFLQFETQGHSTTLPIQLEARISEYLSMTLQLIFVFGVCFLLPVLVLLLNRIGLLHFELLARTRRYAFLLILITSAILTPPDMISMIALAAPLYLLYEISILLVKLLEKQQSLITRDHSA